jgi:hypothetical protein
MLAKSNDQMVASARMLANTVYTEVMKALGEPTRFQKYVLADIHIDCLVDRSSTVTESRHDIGAYHPAQEFMNTSDNMVRKDALRKGLSDTGVAQEVTTGAAPTNAQSVQRTSPDSGKSLWVNAVTRPLNPTG